MRRSRIRSVCEWAGVVGVVGLLYRFVDKYSLIEVINRGLPIEEAGILRGMVLGEKGGLGRDVYEGLKRSGLVHLVVASGANVMLLVNLIVENLAGWLGRKKTVVLALTVVWGYAAMVGWQAPIVRAGIFISIFYWAQLLGRRFDLWRGLGLTVVMMLLAWGEWFEDAGFWLSLLAFVAIATKRYMIYDLPAMPAGRQAGRTGLRFMNKTILNDLITTVWVGMWVTPVLGLVFGQISLMAPLTNIMVLFLVEYITIVGSLGAIVGLGWFWLGEKILWLVLPALRYVGWIVANLGWGVINLRFNWLMLGGWYLVLGWWVLKRRYEI